MENLNQTGTEYPLLPSKYFIIPNFKMNGVRKANNVTGFHETHHSDILTVVLARWDAQGADLPYCDGNAYDRVRQSRNNAWEYLNLLAIA